MSDTVLHELCKGFGALLSRSKTPAFAEDASRRNERGNLPLHAACSFQPTPEVVEILIKAFPDGPRITNNIGNLPLHQAAMWQASVEVVDILLERHADGAATRNQYGSLPLHMAASNQAKPDVVRRLVDVYPEALHIQNDDGMTPLDLCLADESASETVVAMLEGRPPPPELTPRQEAEKYQERADAVERKLGVFRESSGRQRYDLQLAVLAVRRLADNIPHALYSAGIDPNELELALSHGQGGVEAEDIILDMIKKISKNKGMVNHNGHGELNGVGGRKALVDALDMSNGSPVGVRDRVEDLLDTIVGLEHIKSQIRGLRRTTEISDLLESLSPNATSSTDSMMDDHATTSLGPNSLIDRPSRASSHHLVFIGNPGTGKSTLARLLAKIYHELGVLRKPKYLEVERMDLVARTTHNTIIKTREVIDEARGGILLIDESYSLGLATRRDGSADCGNDAIQEIITMMDKEEDDFPLVILAGFPDEMHRFVATQSTLKTRFPLSFQFPDYTCTELAMIFADMAHIKGFDLGSDCTIEAMSTLLERETSVSWRNDRNGRICEMLLAGARQQVRMRMRAAAFDGEDGEEVDPQLIVMADIENVVATEFK